MNKFIEITDKLLFVFSLVYFRSFLSSRKLDSTGWITPSVNIDIKQPEIVAILCWILLIVMCAGVDYIIWRDW